jgi:uncharacterized protein YegP (UPF0339 family)
MGKFVIKTGKDGQYYFNLKASNGEIILSSEGYTSKRSCKKGIASVMKNATDESRFVTAVSKNGKPYFNLKAGNHRVIGKSEMYESEKACKNGIASVKKNAPGAKIEG